MKKLIPAIALLVISSLLLSVASYAWFSMNTTVTATNMSVKATTSKNLVISLNGTVWNQSVDADTALTSMLPVSTSNLEDWFTTTEQGKKKVDFGTGQIATPVAGDFEEASNPDDVTTGFYYLEKSFYIKVSAEDTEANYSKLYVSGIELLGNTLDISKSVRVGVKVGEEFFIYSPNGGDTTYNAITDTAGTVQAVTAYGSYTSAQNLGEVNTTGVKVDVYIWYEGQDSNNTSLNAMSAEAVTFAISFKAE